jgi:hypothetical protein
VKIIIASDDRRNSLVFGVDLRVGFMIIYRHAFTKSQAQRGGTPVATKTNFILKVSDAKLSDVQKALKDANITVVSIMEVHKEEA